MTLGKKNEHKSLFASLGGFFGLGDKIKQFNSKVKTLGKKHRYWDHGPRYG
jgi:hypothetical protein